jgi:flagellar hook protein FlgE
MSFQTGLSGLNASSRNLDVIGNNIANANTTGMKTSRTEFSGLVSSALASSTSAGAGIGVEVVEVSQLFTQGNITTTNNNLDIAINGSGFFQLKQADGTSAYTRDGSFKLDKNGEIKNNGGANLMGFPTDVTGVPTSASLQKLTLPTAAPVSAKATGNIQVRLNLDARAQLAAGDNTAVPPIAPTPRSTYGTSINVYDAQGLATPVNLYFEKQAAANTWNIYGGLNVPASAGPPVIAAVTYPSLGSITFDASGHITAPANASATNLPPPDFAIELAAGTIPSQNPNDATAPGVPGFLAQPILLDLGTFNPDRTINGISQYGTNFAVSDLTQDGYTSGELIGVNIGADGVVEARYSNGQTQSAGQVALADFRNLQGLTPLGGNAWAESFASGLPVQGAPGVGKFGALRAGALEESNVDLTAELVNMMTAQRAYQANAQTIKTQDQIMSTLVNLK